MLQGANLECDLRHAWLSVCSSFGKLVKLQWWLGIPGKSLRLLCPDPPENGHLSDLDLAFVLENYFALLLLCVFAWQSWVWDVGLGERDKGNNEALTSHCFPYSNTIFHLGKKQLKCLFVCVCIGSIYMQWSGCDQCADLGFQNFLFDTIVLLEYVTIYIYIKTWVCTYWDMLFNWMLITLQTWGYGCE